MQLKKMPLTTRFCKLLKRMHLNHSAAYITLVRLLAPESDAAIAMLSSRNPFLIVSTGRTGTKWLASLLHRSPGACVMHEPVPDEQSRLIQAISDQDAACRYLQDFRLREMALRINDENPVTYGEVNSTLRFHISHLQKLLPELRIIHLVRDGRDVIRSILNRRFLRRSRSALGNIHPPVVDDYTARWDSLTEFEKLCWGWQYENRYMRQSTEMRARFEDITASYRHFYQQILKPLGLSIPEQEWRCSIHRPLNTTKSFIVAPWEEWTNKQQRQFSEICADEMIRYEYCPDAGRRSTTRNDLFPGENNAAGAVQREWQDQEQ